ncbi:MAG: hypothetical protein ABIJ09_07105 [Pseudomonadota bacterium]
MTRPDPGGAQRPAAFAHHARCGRVFAPWLLVLSLLCSSCASSPEPRQDPVPVVDQAQATPATASGEDQSVMVAPVGSPEEPAAGEARHLAELRQLTSTGRNAAARFAGDGSSLVFVTLRAPVPYQRLVQIQLGGDGEEIVPIPGRPGLQGVSLVEGGLIVVLGQDLGPAPRGVLEILAEGAAKPLVAASETLDVADLAVAWGSRELFFSARRDGRRALFVARLDGSMLTRLTDGTFEDAWPAPTPDGTQVAFRRELEEEHSEIFLLERSSGAIRPLTGLGGRNWTPAMHPSGEQVVFGSGYYGERDHELMVVSTRGLQVERVTQASGFDGQPCFDPRGEILAWTSSRQGGVPQVWVARWLR